MAEPTSGAAAFAATASAITSAIFGVDYFAIVWGFIGSMFALINNEPTNKLWAIAYVSLSSLIGAAIGSALYEYLAPNQPKIILIALCAIVGFGSKRLLTSAIRGGEKKLGGNK